MARFGWYELYTSDPNAAQAFYGKVVGWTTQAWEHAPDYTMWVAPEGPIGAVMALPAEASAAGAPPHWIGYVGVADVAATTERVLALGGRVEMPATDLPNGSRFALVADPAGGRFGLHQSGSGQSEMEPKEGPGQMVWCELMSLDPGAALAFYAELFGWEKDEAMDMGEMGTYQLIKAGGAPMAFGGVMKSPPDMPVSAWAFYAAVASADTAAEAIKEGGGQVLHGPVEVPGGGRIVMFTDPQGAMSAVFAPGPAA